ncbi:MAG: hypothetical protein NZM04_09255 [Methylacidiphilales bacterium]|nr:hypothetical protein [Candidatus Methylacidiphilales bacterium]
MNVYTVYANDGTITYEAKIATDTSDIDEVAWLVALAFVSSYDFDGSPPTPNNPLEVTITVSTDDEEYEYEYEFVSRKKPPKGLVMLENWIG